MVGIRLSVKISDRAHDELIVFAPRHFKSVYTCIACRSHHVRLPG